MKKRMAPSKTLFLPALVILFATVASADVRPAIVRDLDNGDRQEMYLEDITVLQFDGLRASDECLDLVPAGKRLVIEP